MGLRKGNMKIGAEKVNRLVFSPLISLGEVLVEVEPVKYEVGPLQWSHLRRKIQSQEEIQLAHTILDREVLDDDYNLTDGGIATDEEPVEVAATLTYVNSHSVYLGQVKKKKL